jgi:hypothetical protein
MTTNPLAEAALFLASKIQSESANLLGAPEEGYPSKTQTVIPMSVVRGTRGYIEKVANQVNGTYEHGWFDSCAVMIRRLIETLIIEAFEHHGIAHKIKGASGDFFYLSDLISITLSENIWNLSRNAKSALPRLKDIGDKSAHSRRFNAHKRDIDKVVSDVRVVVQELVYLAALK